MVLQVNGSAYQWFGQDLPRCTILGAIDDATGMVTAALFREQEDAQGYFLLIKHVPASFVPTRPPLPEGTLIAAAMLW